MFHLGNKGEREGGVLPVILYEEALPESGPLFRQKVYDSLGSIFRELKYKKGWGKTAII